MNTLSGLRLATFSGVATALSLGLSAPLFAEPSASPVDSGAAILMGTAVAASTQTLQQQQADREALRKRLTGLVQRGIDRDLMSRMRNDYRSRVVRVVFDIDEQGKATNVRVGKRSGSRALDASAGRMISRFNALPGGQRKRVCAVMQLGRPGQRAEDAAYIKALKDEEASAIEDMRLGRDGPTYDRRGRIVS